MRAAAASSTRRCLMVEGFKGRMRRPLRLHGMHGNAVSQQVRPPEMKPQDFFNQSDFTFMLEKARD
jgi:hypothetical protein